MRLQILEYDLTVCKVPNAEHVNFTREFLFFAKTPDELSVVCEKEFTPQNASHVEDGWRGLMVVGVLDFGLVGILAKIAAVLAGAGVSIFAVSTYNTDYILMKKDRFDEGVAALVAAGYILHK